LKISIGSILKFIIFVGIGALIFYLLYVRAEASYVEECALKGIPESDCSLIDKLKTDLKSSKLIWLVVILIGYMLSNIFRALRWNQMIEPLGYQPKFINSLGALMIGYFTNMAAPIADYFAASFEFPGWFSWQLMVGLALAGLATLYFLNRYLLNSHFEGKLMSKLQSIALGLKEGLMSLTKVKNLPLLIAYTLGIWIMYYLMTYLCFFAYKPVEHLGPIAGLVVFVFGTLGMVFPSPGGMGSYNLLITQALVIFGINEADAFSFSMIIFFTINIFGNVIFGLLFFIILPFYNKSRVD